MLLPLLIVLAVFLGGAVQRWSQAIVIGLFGCLVVIRPPRRSLGLTLNMVALLFLTVAACAFLPGHWFASPDWRVALMKDFGVALPDMVSVQPWLTLDSLWVLVAGLAWIYYLAALSATLREIRLATRLFAAGMIILAALSVYLFLNHQALPFWHNQRGFGPFPNRNQSGDLFGISAIVTLGCLQDDVRRRHWKRCVLWLVGLAILVAALILAFSRAGILILIIGFAAWIVRLAFRKWSGPGVAIAASLFLLLFAALMLFGGETIERFKLQLGSEGSVTSDFRWLIFHDAWAMIQTSPVFGLGLGNFESVFALFREVSRGATRSLHPESDWLWVWAEMGWPALGLLAIAAAILVWRVFPLREGSNQRLRYTALIGALLFLLHGFVDVSGHRFGSFLAGTFLLGMAQLRPNSLRVSRLSPILFRLVGLLLIVVSATWFAVWRQMLQLPGRLGVENTREAIIVANRGHRFGEALALADQGLQWAPLDWQLYFLRALTRIGDRQPVAQALDDFRRARFLEPSAYQLPFEEGKIWLGWQPALAFTAWRDALQREGAEAAGIYSLMLAQAAQYDAQVLEDLRQFAIHRPALTIKYLEAAKPEQFEAEIDLLLAQDPNLRQFTPEQMQRLFELWSSHDPLDRLLSEVGVHPEWADLAWRGLARHHAGREEFAAAWALVRQHAPRPAMPRLPANGSVTELEQRFAANPDDVAVGYQLYVAQMTAGRVDDALDTVRHFTSRPDSPAYFIFLEAETWGAKENWQRAWQLWVQYQMEAPNHGPF